MLSVAYQSDSVPSPEVCDITALLGTNMAVIPGDSKGDTTQASVGPFLYSLSKKNEKPTLFRECNISLNTNTNAHKNAAIAINEETGWVCNHSRSFQPLLCMLSTNL